MNGSYLEQQTEVVQNAKSPVAGFFTDDATRLDGGSSYAGRFRAVPRFFCGLSVLLLLVLWPSSDWIGLLVLSQALFAAAYLLKSTSAGPSTKSSAANGPISVARGEDHAH